MQNTKEKDNFPSPRVKRVAKDLCKRIVNDGGHFTGARHAGGAGLWAPTGIHAHRPALRELRRHWHHLRRLRLLTLPSHSLNQRSQSLGRAPGLCVTLNVKGWP